jgi:Ni/Co efflux regulator RcnB
MKTRLVAPLLVAVALVAANTQVLADGHDDHHDGQEAPHYVHHSEWKKGAKIHDEDWKRGEQVDYRQHHLRTPPHGYEWRQVDGNYVLAAVATGVIASVIAASIAGR